MAVECHYCGRAFPREAITKDHIVPKKLGGRNGRANIVMACGPCNSAKGHKRPTCDCEKCRNAIAAWWRHPLDR